MSVVISKLKETNCDYIDATWHADSPEERNDLYALAENMGYKLVNIYTERGHLALDDCTHGTLFLEPLN